MANAEVLKEPAITGGKPAAGDLLRVGGALGLGDRSALYWEAFGKGATYSTILVIVLVAEGAKEVGDIKCSDNIVGILDRLGIKHASYGNGKDYTISYDQGRAARLAGMFGDLKDNPEFHRSVAKLLGFPDCCIEAFVNRTPESSAKRWKDYMDEAVKLGSKSKVMGAVALVPHVPCSVDCVETAAQAKRNIDVLKRAAPWLQDMLVEWWCKVSLTMGPKK